jgi:hypothetical protein
LSASTIDAHADIIRTKHASADGRVEAAQRGLPAGSAVALRAAVGKWQTAGTATVGRLIEDGTGLRTGAQAYVATDADGAASVHAAGNRIRPDDMGL